MRLFYFYIDILADGIYNFNIPPGGILKKEMFLLHEHEHTKAVINRLARAIGHLSSVKKMVENGRDCSDVLIQLSAVKAEIVATEKVILKDHLEHCVADAVLSGDNDSMKNLMNAVDKLL